MEGGNEGIVLNLLLLSGQLTLHTETFYSLTLMIKLHSTGRLSSVPDMKYRYHHGYELVEWDKSWIDT